MKRKIAQKDGTSKKSKEDGVASDIDLLVRLCSIVNIPLDFEIQRTISHLNRRLADIIESNAEHQLKKFKRHIKEDKYM